MLCLTFDNFGCGADYGYGQGRMSPQQRPSVVPESEWNRYNEIGLEIGLPRIQGLLKALEIPTSFCAEGYAAVIHPVELKRWADDGHEVLLHGWKHEIWRSLPDSDTEDRLLTLAMAAMRETLGDRAPVGFRGPGFKLNEWSEALLIKHGIKYVSHVTKRSQEFADRFKSLGLHYPDEGNDVILKQLAYSPCSDELTDAYIVEPADGGMFGLDNARIAYDNAFDLAVAHETAKPNEPWVFVSHPLISGNRAWYGYDRFVRRLHERFGSKAFKTVGEVALGSRQANVARSA